ncbi:MAG: extracellular solute-binding protein [Oscillospiraceae bacterium]
MRKFLCAGLAAFLLLSTVVGCASSAKNSEEEEEYQNITLKISGDYGSTLEERINEFQKLHQGEVGITYVITDREEEIQKDGILVDPAHAADIFTFYNDQFEDYYAANVLKEIDENAEEVLKESGGKDSAAADVCTVDGKLYAYPLTTGNGYFLYYNKKFLSEDDVQSLDQILKVARENNAAFSMDFSSGWYLFSFFKGAGLDLHYNANKTANICEWASVEGEHSGVSVAKSMLEIAKNSGFLNLPNGEMTAQAKEGKVIAAVSGPWHAAELSEIWGEDMGAAKLPTYEVDGEDVQMAAFTGYKLLGVNAKSPNAKWAMRLAKYLTSEKAQLARFEESGECPANVKASLSDEVAKSPVDHAIAEQAPYSYIQAITDSFWDPSSEFGQTIAAGNPDNIDLQELLDKTVAGITKPVNIVAN